MAFQLRGSHGIIRHSSAYNQADLAVIRRPKYRSADFEAVAANGGRRVKCRGVRFDSLRLAMAGVMRHARPTRHGISAS